LRLELSRKRALVLAVLLILIPVLCLAATAVAFAIIGPRSLLEFAAARLLDRQLAIGRLQIGWGNPLSVELANLRLANVSWGSEPDMITVDQISADIDLVALLHGIVRYDKLAIVRPHLLLERNAEGTANWHFKDRGSPASDGLAIIPKNRGQFPTLLELALSEGTIVLRNAGSRELRIELSALTISSPGEDQLPKLELRGALNGTKVQLAAEGGAFSVMRDRTVPYPSRFMITTPAGATIRFDGVITEPLDFDGVEGKLEIATPKLGELLKFDRSDLGLNQPLNAAGAFLKRGPQWRLSNSAGALEKNPFSGTFILSEGGRGQPDAVALDAAFDNLELESLFADKLSAKAKHSRDGMSLRIEPKPGATIDARITAKRASYDEFHASNLALHAASAPNEISIDALSFGVAGGRIEASGSARSVRAGTQVTADISLSGADAESIAQLAGAESGQIGGRLDGHAIFEMTGDALLKALKRSRGQVTLAMSTGRIARAFIEKASTDLRAIFRTAEGWVPLSCALGIIDLRDGIATINRLRMRTPDTTLVGHGAADLLSNRLDVVIRAESARSRFFALDLPIRITGDFGKLKVAPGSEPPGEEAGAVARHGPATAPQALADSSPCHG
jgi:AsmA family protein